MSSTISALANAITIVPSIPNALASSANGISSNNNTNSASTTSSNNNTTVGTPTTSNIINNSIANFNNQIEEKVYKKEKQILIEFEAKTKGKYCFFFNILYKKINLYQHKNNKNTQFKFIFFVKFIIIVLKQASKIIIVLIFN
jgi:hypothetical protein